MKLGLDKTIPVIIIEDSRNECRLFSSGFINIQLESGQGHVNLAESSSNLNHQQTD